ncbi:MAG: hypothetical protein IT278_11280, partial [Ignavibacteriaceae bacterium]|nr:hypothetical protein [Ignavibacteriaceae bacterium]
IGATQVVIFLSAIFFFASKLSFPSETTTKSSLLYKTVTGVLPGIIDVIVPSRAPGSIKKGTNQKELDNKK